MMKSVNATPKVQNDNNSYVRVIAVVYDVEKADYITHTYNCPSIIFANIVCDALKLAENVKCIRKYLITDIDYRGTENG